MVLVGDVEDDHPVAHPRAVGPITQRVGPAVQRQAVLSRVRAPGGELPLVLRSVGLSGRLVLPRMPPGARRLGVGRVGDVDDGQHMPLEAGQGAGGVDPRAAIVEVAVRAGGAADPVAQQLGPVGFVHVPDEEAVLRRGGGSPIVRPGGRCSSAVIIVPSATCTWMVMELGGPSRNLSSSGCSGSVTSIPSARTWRRTGRTSPRPPAWPA